jgi:hypothetical protein
VAFRDQGLTKSVVLGSTYDLVSKWPDPIELGEAATWAAPACYYVPREAARDHTGHFQDGLLHRVKELRGRLSSEVNADRLPGAKLEKAFNQLLAKVLASPPPNDRG